MSGELFPAEKLDEGATIEARRAENHVYVMRSRRRKKWYEPTNKAKISGDIERIRANNRIYATRSRRKKEIARLKQEKSRTQKRLSAEDIAEVDSLVALYDCNVRNAKMSGDELPADKELRVQQSVLQYEVKKMKLLARKKLDDVEGTAISDCRRTVTNVLFGSEE